MITDGRACEFLWIKDSSTSRPSDHLLFMLDDEAALTSFIETVAREIASRELPNGQVRGTFISTSHKLLI